MKTTTLDIFKGYEGLSQTEQINKLSEELEAAGIIGIVRKGQGYTVTYYPKEATVFASFVKNDSDGESFYTIFDRGIYDKYLADRGNLTVLNRGAKRKTIRLYRGVIQKDLHRLVIEEAGYLLKSGLVVDHKFMNPRINTLEALRLCSSQENTMHSKSRLKTAKKRIEAGELAPEFLYDPAEDFTNTWYTYVLHKMLGIGAWEELLEYNMAYVS